MENGIRIAMMTLAKHVPSHVTIVGHRLQVSYEGQQMTCYGCNGTGHFYQGCPVRGRAGDMEHTAAVTSWADIATQGTDVTRESKEAAEEGA